MRYCYCAGTFDPNFDGNIMFVYDDYIALFKTTRLPYLNAFVS